MSRPAKSLNLQSRHNTKAEKDKRAEAENVLKGGNDKIIPPEHFTNSQKEYFNYIVSELQESGILSNLDIFILETASVAIDRIRNIEKLINDDTELLKDKNIMSAKDKYTKDFFRCCNELCLSPQARAKIGSLNLSKAKEKDNPLKQLLKEAEADDG